MQRRSNRIGYLSPGPGIEYRDEAFRQALGQRGYVEDRNLVIDWRFTKGDPAGVNSADLLYDVRPTGRQEDERQRRAEDTADAQKLGTATNRILKPWILPSGNAFLKDASKHYQRPEGNPGEDLPFVQSTFDDSAWQPVTLPHDWAIAGPFHKGGGGKNDVGWP